MYFNVFARHFFILLVCAWRHDGHVDYFSPLGTKLYCHVNSSGKIIFSWPPNMATLSRSCEPRIMFWLFSKFFKSVKTRNHQQFIVLSLPESKCLSEDDSRWEAMCNHVLNKRGSHSKDALLGMEECQSPFGIYELKIPIDKSLECKTNTLTTKNCKDLDVRTYLAFMSFSILLLLLLLLCSICKLPIRSEIYNWTFKNTNKVSTIISIDIHKFAQT